MGLRACVCEPNATVSILALFIAFFQPAHDVLYGPHALCSFIASALAVVSKAAPALGVIIVGGSFGLLLLQLRGSGSTRLSLADVGLSWRLLFIVAFSRIVIAPSLCLGFLYVFIDILPVDKWS